MLGVVGALLVGALVLGGIGNALGAKGKHQRAADLAAVSAAAAMSDAYPRLFEPAWLEPGVPNPRHLPLSDYLALARGAAVRAARRNGVGIEPADVAFPERGSFAPVRVRVTARGESPLPRPLARAQGGAGRGDRTAGRRGGDTARPARSGERDRNAAIPVEASAAAEIVASAAGGLAMPAYASGGGYSGPLAYRMGKGMRPDVAQAFDRMAAAARREAGVHLAINSAFRSDQEQARLWAANPNPRWVAPPGTSLHRYATELDLGPPAAYGWLKRNAARFGFIHRYAWEGWHYGFGSNPRDVPAQYERGSWEPPGGDHDRVHHRLPSFVPERFHQPIARAALRWNVPMNLLAAQLYAESGFNPFARSPAGAQGIAQFMPGTARSYGLRNPFDPEQAIDAQAHLMSDLLRRFKTYSLALAAYNAGPGAVERFGGVPPYAETRAYVAKILGLLGGAGEIAVGASSYAVKLVE